MIGRRVEAIADLHRVRVLSPGQVVGDHDRPWAKHQTVSRPEHVTAATALRRERITLVYPAVSGTSPEVEVRSLSHYDHAFPERIFTSGCTPPSATPRRPITRTLIINQPLVTVTPRRPNHVLHEIFEPRGVARAGLGEPEEVVVLVVRAGGFHRSVDDGEGITGHAPGGAVPSHLSVVVVPALPRL